MKLKNYQLDALAKIIDYPMKFVKSRIKNKFLNSIVPKIQEREKSRMEIINALAKKDKEGSYIMEEIDEVLRYSFTDTNLQKFNKEYGILQEEDVEVDINGDILEMIEKSSVEMNDKLGETKIIEEIIELFDKKKKEKKS